MRSSAVSPSGVSSIPTRLFDTSGRELRWQLLKAVWQPHKGDNRLLVYTQVQQSWAAA
jgi:hypothetical protein